MTDERRDLHQVADLYGVETSYHGIDGNLYKASTESLVAVLQALGAPMQHPDDAPDAIRSTKQQRWQQLAEPVAVAWEGTMAEVIVRIADSQSSSTLCCEMVLESGDRKTWECNLSEAPVIHTEQIEGVTYSARRLDLPQLPPGYHRLTMAVGKQRAETFIIAAPEQAYRGELFESQRAWGLFLPLYALRRNSERSQANLSDFQELLHWAGQQGATYVATLPLLAGDLAEDPGPYAPSSQCWWNEFYLDPSRIPEFSHAKQAHALIKKHDRERPAREAATSYVDYPREARLQREVLESLADGFFSGPSERRESLEAYCRCHPEIESYARFRATQESHGSDWTRWPQHLQENPQEDEASHQAAYRRHLYAQWNMEQQMEQLASWTRSKGLTWYLDLPLGCSRTGYDAWRHQELFAPSMSGGAPPDAFFSKGQDWGFPPLQPDQLRLQHYDYFINVLRRQMQHAELLRLDHAMRFERLFWVPQGMEASQGVYVRYPADEFFAILTLESQRTKTRLVGENLGTVSESLNERLLRHRIDGTYVLQFEVHAREDQPINPVPTTSAACLNTHDMAPFAAFIAGFDIDDRIDLELLDEDGALHEWRQRQRVRRCLVSYLHREGWLTEWTLDPELVLDALQRWLAASGASSLTINVEDLWLETRQQNTPGTSTERPNWQRQAKYTLDEISRHPGVLRLLRNVDRLRKSGKTGTE